jgi:hypothetical protein
MKINKEEKASLSISIDKLTEGLDEIIQLYNDSEEDKPLIKFDSQVSILIEQAIKNYGEEFVSKKINTIVGEMLEWLPLNNLTNNQNEDQNPALSVILDQDQEQN